MFLCSGRAPEAPECTHTLVGHSECVTALIRQWSLQEAGGSCVFTFRGHAGAVAHLALSRDGRVLYSAGDDATVRAWDTAGGGCAFVMVGHRGGVLQLRLSEDDAALFTSAADGRVRQWDARTGGLCAELVAHRSPVDALALAPGGVALFSGDNRGIIRAWDVGLVGDNWRPPREAFTLDAHTGAITALAASAPLRVGGDGDDGSLLASASGDRTLRLWRGRTGELLHVLRGHSGVVWSVLFVPRSRLLLSGGEDGAVAAWRLADGALVARSGGAAAGGAAATDDAQGPPAECHRGAVSEMLLSPSGRLLYSLGADHEVRVWALPAAGAVRAADRGAAPAPLECRFVLEGHTEALYCCAVSEDGAFVFTGGHDAVVRVWRVATLTRRPQRRGGGGGARVCSTLPRRARPPPPLPRPLELTDRCGRERSRRGGDDNSDDTGDERDGGALVGLSEGSSSDELDEQEEDPGPDAEDAGAPQPARAESPAASDVQR